MGICPLPEAVVIARADRLAQTTEPGPGPGELDTQNREPDRDDDERGPGRHNHDDAKQQNGGTDDTDNDAPCRLVRKMNRFPYQPFGPSFLPRLAVALGQ